LIMATGNPQVFTQISNPFDNQGGIISLFLCRPDAFYFTLYNDDGPSPPRKPPS
jgi:hypothetical protein